MYLSTCIQVHTYSSICVRIRTCLALALAVAVHSMPRPALPQPHPVRRALLHAYLSSIRSLRSATPSSSQEFKKNILISSNRAQPLFHFPRSCTVPEKSLHFCFLACFLSHDSPLPSPPPPPLPKESPLRYPAVYYSFPVITPTLWSIR